MCSVTVHCLRKWLCQRGTISEGTDAFVCHYPERHSFWFVALHTDWRNGRGVSVCCWQSNRKVTKQGVIPRVLVITSLWAPFFIPSVPEAFNGNWLKRPPIHKDLLERLLGIYDMQSIGSEPAKSPDFVFSRRSNFANAAQWHSEGCCIGCKMKTGRLQE